MAARRLPSGCSIYPPLTGCGADVVGEATPTIYHLIGGVIILAGVVYSQVKSYAEKQSR